MEISNVIDYLRTKLSEEEFNKAVELMNKVPVNGTVDEVVVRISALLYHQGVDRAYEYLIDLDIPLDKAEKICKCLSIESESFPEKECLLAALQ